MATEGLTAPDGHLWCRGRGGTWHLLRAHELVHEGRARVTARSVCGLWASLLPEENGWAEVAQRATPEPRRMCVACLTAVGDARRRDRLATPPAEQPRLL
jgi:hypothetical protein